MEEPVVIRTERVKAQFPVRRRLRLRNWWWRQRNPEMAKLGDEIAAKIEEEVIHGRRTSL